LRVNIYMQMLYDRHPRLPYHAIVPWPVISVDGHQLDWIMACTSIEDWLEASVGPHWSSWSWDMYNVDNSRLCGVRFLRETDSLLFVLRWG